MTRGEEVAARAGRSFAAASVVVVVAPAPLPIKISPNLSIQQYLLHTKVRGSDDEQMGSVLLSFSVGD